MIAEALQAAKAHARASYAYLAGAGSAESLPLDTSRAETSLLPGRAGLNATIGEIPSFTSHSTLAPDSPALHLGGRPGAGVQSWERTWWP